MLSFRSRTDPKLASVSEKKKKKNSLGLLGVQRISNFQIGIKKMSEEASRSMSGHGNEQTFLDLEVKPKLALYTRYYHYSQ